VELFCQICVIREGRVFFRSSLNRLWADRARDRLTFSCILIIIILKTRGGSDEGRVEMLELNEKIKEHFRNPLNVGEIENPEGTGAVDNPICGDTTKIYLRIKDSVVEDAKFLSFGCAVTIASASVFTEKIKGKKISWVFSGGDEEVIQRLITLIESELGEILR